MELGTLTISPDEYIYDFSFPKDGGKPNPHLWTNPPMAKCYAAIAAAAMAKADPANAAYYEGNATAYGAKIDELDRLMKDATAGMPAGNRELLTYHDAYAYFAAHYGWKVIGAIQVSNFEDPTPKEVTALIGQIEEEKVPAIFGSEVFPSPVLAQIGKETGVEVRRPAPRRRPARRARRPRPLLPRPDEVRLRHDGRATSAATRRSSRRFDASDVVTDQADYPQ